MSRRAFPAAFAALVLSGCSPGVGGREEAASQNVVTVHLDETNREANARLIAAFFGTTCLEAGESAAAVQDAVQRSGWVQDQVQAASSGMPIAAWRLERGELVHSAMNVGGGNNFVDCELVLDGAIAPSLERIRDALRPLLRYPGLREVSAGPPEARWEWPTGLRAERALTVGPARPEPGRGPRLSLHLRITETASIAAPAELNEIGLDAANVQ